MGSPCLSSLSRAPRSADADAIGAEVERVLAARGFPRGGPDGAEPAAADHTGGDSAAGDHNGGDAGDEFKPAAGGDACGGSA